MLTKVEFVLEASVLLLAILTVSFVIRAFLFQVWVLGRSLLGLLLLTVTLTRLAGLASWRRRARGQRIVRQSQRVCTQLGEISQPRQSVSIDSEVLDGLFKTGLFGRVFMRIDWHELFDFLVRQVLAAFVCHEPLFLFLGRQIWFFVDPLDRSDFLFQRLVVGRWNRPHLRVDEGVPEKKLFARIGRSLIRELVPLARDVQVVQILQASLVQGQLVDESGPDLQVWSAAVQKLETLEERPLVLAHDVAGQGARCTALASHRVHKD